MGDTGGGKNGVPSEEGRVHVTGCKKIQGGKRFFYQGNLRGEKQVGRGSGLTQLGAAHLLQRQGGLQRGPKKRIYMELCSRGRSRYSWERGTKKVDEKGGTTSN